MKISVAIFGLALTIAIQAHAQSQVVGSPTTTPVTPGTSVGTGTNTSPAPVPTPQSTNTLPSATGTGPVTDAIQYPPTTDMLGRPLNQRNPAADRRGLSSDRTQAPTTDALDDSNFNDGTGTTGTNTQSR